jgi:O-antigen/teichoic acid export membrane protein
MVLPVAAILMTIGDSLIYAWVGHKSPSLMGSVAVVQILAVAVALRVGNASGTVILKGAGEHRMVAWTNVLTGVVNLILSVLLVRRYGLIGVAIGTLIPVGFASVFVLYPAACRRVGLSPWSVAAQTVWPPLWPAVIVGGLLALIGHTAQPTLLRVAVEAAAASVVYLWLFLAVAIGRSDRALYTSKALEILGRRALPSPI